jgi:thiopeptide-type bacteriocin biosynthesis protein
LEIWNARSAKLAPLAAALRAAEARQALSWPVTRLIDSYLHMSVNRLARGAGREHELVIFDFLNRHYLSMDARARGAAHVRGERT